MIIVKPYSTDKNLGKEYNRIMELIPEGEHACLMDIDTMFLTPNQPALIIRYIEKYPDCVLTAYTNRISPLSQQLHHGIVSENADIKVHIACANKMQLHNINEPLRVKRTLKPISGFLMVVPKKVWQKIPFVESGNCLGVDTAFSRALFKKYIPILIMESIYIWHTYRIENGIFDKKHLV